ncbi:hypothetical protein L596_030197 [Steinernema carpocapsae]|uniref:Cathepsin propeptide inhibitor domain-containing protein n=1 Tax=Steinernema carpocapsae TaxID=34508 RepID=A0A4U5LS02_STECR|nr:hypothetical protein L596_030197 [Steinernema carpocapsae]
MPLGKLFFLIALVMGSTLAFNSRINPKFVQQSKVESSEISRFIEEGLKVWEDFKVKYNKNYASEEEEKLRLLTFLSNLEMVRSTTRGFSGERNPIRWL